MDNSPNVPSREWDIRVRQRNLSSGVLTDKTVRQFLEALPDLEENAESIELAQPALGGRDE